jgi:hypothetical protein
MLVPKRICLIVQIVRIHEANVKTVFFLLYPGVGQTNGNTTDTVHISLLIWRWTTFCLQYSSSPSWNGLVRVLKFLTEFYTILLEEHLEVALEMSEVGIRSSL